MLPPFLSFLASLFADDDQGKLPPGTPPTCFSPHEAHLHQAFFGWIVPTIRTSEFTVLQIVGLDAAVLLNFFKMSFQLFSICSLFAIFILMPINWKNNVGLGEGDGGGDDDDDDWPSQLAPTPELPQNPSRDWLDLISDANSYLSVHLIFTYLFTILALRAIYKNYQRFIRSRQLFSLELVHSIPARTVMVTNLPKHLQSERSLAEYFENMGLSVESVSVCREVHSLKVLLDRRTDALMALERAWVDYVGNPSTVEEYDPSDSVAPPLADLESSGMDGHSNHSRFVVPHKPRPTIRPRWYRPKVDALEYLEKQFLEADELVKKKRKTGRFRPTQAAFVTFEKMSSAQVAMQVAHAPSPMQCTTYPAPEPRDIVWANMTPSTTNIRTRDTIVLSAMAFLFFFWIFPITALASLLSYNEIKKAMPWLGRLIDSNDKIQAIVQNSLPSIAMITLNATLPLLLEALTYLQGFRARSWIEYSLMKKYFLFLLVNVVFIFLLASTYWQLVRDLANSPAKIPEKLAQALSAGRARHFFLSYVILQGLGIMPLQLLNLGVLLPRFFYRMFLTRTPRDFAELNAPPMINYGVVYPQAILMFVITMLYSVNQPLIVIFGAVYFGVAYVVYKYKLLFVFYKPYESQGQAWPLTFIRLVWGIVIFLVFMTGIFILRKSYVLSSLLSPLLLGTVVWSWYVHKNLRALSKFVSLSSVHEVERGEETADVVRIRAGHPVTWSQSNLSRRRYAQNDDTLYVAPEDERTDYVRQPSHVYIPSSDTIHQSQPPMANWYSGVLNTGKRRYGHPALNGVLPEPWLPLKKGQTLVNNNGDHRGSPRVTKDAVVLTLRKRPSMRRTSRLPLQQGSQTHESLHGIDISSSRTAIDPHDHEDVVSPPLPPRANPWDDVSLAPPTHSHQHSSTHLQRRLSFDHASGVIMLPEDDDWLEEDEDSDQDFGTASGILEQHNGGGDGGRGGGGLLINVTPETPSSTQELSMSPTEDGRPSGGSNLVASPTRSSRYGTYFHHPERRRQPIPGAFPTANSRS
ncbi:hypothetical protein ONZ45_g18815 [Pleurotus djamor]|nr:hypothetical protein ONZ45_g18815 [Pleurotus djamor]